jgi:hypothetical protein
MGLVDKIGVFGIVPLFEDLAGEVVMVVANQHKHFLRARVDEL